MLTAVLLGAALAALGVVSASARPMPGASPADRAAGTAFNAVDVVGATAWAAGDGGVVLRLNQGTGAKDVFSAGSTYDIQGIDFVTATVGYAVAVQSGGKAVVLKTTDGGSAWKVKKKAAVDLLAAARFANASVGWVAGRNGTILKTTNGGGTWTKEKSGTTRTLYSLCASGSSVVYAAGAQGAVIKSTNGGAKWAAKKSGTKADLYTIDASGGSIWAGGVLGSAGAIVRSTNGGRSFKAVGGTLTPVAQIDFCNASTGYLVAETADFSKGLIMKSTDGGQTWVDQSANVSPAAPNYLLVAVRCVSPTACVAAGDRQSLLNTSDGGGHWTVQNLLTR